MSRISLATVVGHMTHAVDNMTGTSPVTTTHVLAWQATQRQDVYSSDTLYECHAPLPIMHPALFVQLALIMQQEVCNVIACGG